MNPPTEQPVLTRLYRSALRMLPEPFRARFGNEMVELFDSRRRKAAGRDLIKFCCKTVFDLIRTAWRERRRSGGHKASQLPPGRDWSDAVRTDLASALRALRATPGNTAIALVVLTLAIAAATVTFSVVDTIALRRLPFSEPDRLVSIARLENRSPRPEVVASQDFYAWQAEAPAFEAVAATSENLSLRLQADGQAETLIAYRATANLFDVLRVKPALGQSFAAEHEQAGHDRVAVISHGLWVRRFAADPTVVGRPVAFGPDTLQIIGVMPEGFTYPIGPVRSTEAWVPFVPGSMDRDHSRQGRSYLLQVIGRLRAGATIEDARAQVHQIATRVTTEYQSVSWRTARPVVSSLQDWVVGPAKRWLVLALVAVALVLLVAYVNVANLLLARVVARGRELATRAALGASQFRLARTLLLEALILSATASALGLVASIWGVSVATSFLPAGLARASTIALDLRVLVVSIAATFGTGLLFGALPAWQASRAGLAMVTRDTASVMGGGGRTRWQGALLVSEIAFVVTLLLATTLAVTTFVRLITMDLGFDRHNVVAFTLSKSLAAVPEPDRPAAADAWRRDLSARVGAVPGVAGVAVTVYGGLPLSGMATRDSLTIDGFGATKEADMAEVRKVSPGYFDVLGMRLVRGRGIQDADGAGAPQIAVINQIAARRYFGDVDPVGRQIVSSTNWSFRGTTTVVGIVESVRLAGPEADLRPEMYVPIAQHERGDRPIDLVVRTARAPEVTVAPIQEAVRSVMGASARLAPQYPNERFRRITAERRFNAGLMTVFGVFAVIIGGLGIYGVMSFVVAGQVRAIGVRMALGATAGRILRDVLWQTGRYLALGVAIGLVGARLASDLLSALVFGMSPSNPLMYLIVAGVVAAVGFAAALAPGLRAARVDPLIALRTE